MKWRTVKLVDINRKTGEHIRNVAQKFFISKADVSIT